jgi:hypothetical protein
VTEAVQAENVRARLAAHQEPEFADIPSQRSAAQAVDVTTRFAAAAARHRCGAIGQQASASSSA